jgi:hypothetical protein
MPQSIWIMQDRAEVAWSKSVIVEVRKGDEGMLIHVPFNSRFCQLPQPTTRVQIQPRVEFARGLAFEPSTGLFLDIERVISVYICDTPPCGKGKCSKKIKKI